VLGNVTPRLGGPPMSSFLGVSLIHDGPEIG
jgi:hypothetical protein